MPGHAGVELFSTWHTVLTPEMGIKILFTGVYGPLHPETWGFVIGKGSVTVDGLQIYPGVIDRNYQGEIKVMASSPRGIIFVPAYEKIAQLILVPMYPMSPEVITNEAGQSCPGAPEVYWIQSITHKRPNLKLTIQGKCFEGIIDTGAYVNVIRAQNWPPTWPLTESITHLQGIGYANNPKQSSKLLTWRDEKGNSGQFQPYVLPNLPVTLWGRDLLSQMRLVLCSPNELANRQPHANNKGLKHFR